MDVANTNALAEGDFSGVGLLFRAEDGEKSGFACAVGANEADAIAVMDCAGDVVKEGSSAEAFGDILCDQDRRHIPSLRGRDIQPASPAFIRESPWISSFRAGGLGHCRNQRLTETRCHLGGFVSVSLIKRAPARSRSPAKFERG